MGKADFAAAKELIEAKDYRGARRILRDIDDPKAREWEERLNGIDPPKKDNLGAWVFIAVVVLAMILALGVYFAGNSIRNIQATMTAEAR